MSGSTAVSSTPSPQGPRFRPLVKGCDPVLSSTPAGHPVRTGTPSPEQLGTPRVTPDQWRIVEESAQELELDFSRLRRQLSSWQGDALIKGLIVTLELVRRTRQTYLPGACIRLALRSQLGRSVTDPYRSEKRLPHADPALPEQLLAIQHYQREVGLDFTPLLPELTGGEASVIFKGIIVVSELVRLTGQRHYPIRDLRIAIRKFLQESRCR